jgi:hypothetical protein
MKMKTNKYNSGLSGREDFLFNDMVTREQRMKKGLNLKRWLEKWSKKNVIRKNERELKELNK